jgi:hypothetical protein
MIKVNAFALCQYKLAEKGNLAPPHIEIDRQGEGQRGGEIFLEFFAGTDHRAKAKT